MKKAKLYKVLLPGGQPAHGGSGEWSLPKGRKPGAWMPTIKNPKCCKRGYHLVTAVQLIQWLDRDGLEVWEAEGRDAHHDQEDKSAWAEARLVRYIGQWTETNARLFAADCAEAALHIFEKKYPNDNRPRKAIEAARAFALGKIDAAAGSAARAAAWSAAEAAAWAAAEAAEAAAGATAWAAAGDAAGAARSAAWAARSAAWAARDTAWDAAWDATEAAARSAAETAARAAWSTARTAQSRRLLYWLKKGKP